jgi:hypothetical protein
LEAKMIESFKYYRKAVWLPIWATAIAIVVTVLAPSGDVVGAGSRLAPFGMLAFVGACAALPYMAYLLLARRHIWSESARRQRVALFLAPLAAGVPLATAFALLNWRSGAGSSFVFVLSWALATGYFFVAVIELGFWLGAAAGLVDRKPAPLER